MYDYILKLIVEVPCAEGEKQFTRINYQGKLRIGYSVQPSEGETVRITNLETRKDIICTVQKITHSFVRDHLNEDRWFFVSPEITLHVTIQKVDFERLEREVILPSFDRISNKS
ncbi:MAG: hypothetical protein PHE43_00335 [Candidatus Nanoarchaeia archaeon]|nr:hypothetical protein [Candidatus Nanoarchaeia archaeon]